jgi:hypothetical protein
MIVTTIDEHGNPHTEILFDQAAHAAWKADQATWRRNQYAANPGIRAARSETNARAYASRNRRKVAQKTTTGETDKL